MPGKSYSAEEERIIREMWLAGTSPRYIGMRLGGRSSSSIIGKAHRMELPPHLKPDPEPVEFSELDTVPLPRRQRLALETLLDSHPFGVTHKALGYRVFPDEGSTIIVDRTTSAKAVAVALSRALKPYGWACGCTGDRSGVKLYPAEADGGPA